eukprot:5862635-Pleurochrysis_carterae.AAC.1
MSSWRCEMLMAMRDVDGDARCGWRCEMWMVSVAAGHPLARAAWLALRLEAMDVPLRVRVRVRLGVRHHLVQLRHRGHGAHERRRCGARSMPRPSIVRRRVGPRTQLRPLTCLTHP